MSREEVETRLKQLMGNIVEASIESKQDPGDTQDDVIEDQSKESK